jgi:hypothetical protein
MDNSYCQDIEVAKESFCLSGYSSKSNDSKESFAVYLVIAIKIKFFTYMETG